MKIKTIRLAMLGAVCAMLGVVGISKFSYATTGISMSPMNQKIVLTPGETYTGSFQISNGATNDEDLHVKVSVNPFYVNDEYTPIYENNGDYNQIVNWTTIDTTEGTLTPNGHKEIYFSIDVPEDAPAGGQYLAITVTGGDNGDKEMDGTGQLIKVQYAMAHIVYAEIAGTTERKGEISDISAPGILFTGNINATSVIKNTGNVHGTAKYALQVFPLFSSEEVYTNEEGPETKTILPDRSLVSTSYWDATPTIGIYNIVYTVEFEGVTKELKKMVIVCPIWVMILIVVAILLILFRAFARKKN